MFNKFNLLMKNIFLGVFILFLVSCATTKEDIITIDSSPSIVEETNADSLLSVPQKKRDVYREAETILTDLIHTKLEVNFDWPKSRMNGIAFITAKPHFYPSNEIILDAKGMIINHVKLGEKTLEFIYKNDILRVFLDREYSREEKFTVKIDYISCPEERETSGSAAIMSDKGLYFINPKGEDENKMPQIWTQGETESSSVWFPTIDSPNAKTSQEIFITVKDKYKTLSNGRLVSSETLKDGYRVDHWKQDLPHAPYLFMMGIGEFKVVNDFYVRPDGSKMEVNYYVEPEWEPYAKDIFGETPNMIKFFSEKLGVEYPWDKYNQIVVRDYVSGAMENTGAVVFGDFAYKNKRELLDENSQSIIAHELFHHWFGDLVTAESWSNLTLNESFANYSQYLWDEYRYGIDEADYNAEIEADGYYQSAEAQGHHDLVWFDYDDKEQMFDGHSYNKGGRILHMLRSYLGDEAFFLAIQKYLKQNSFKAAEFHQLRLAFEEVSGEDLNWFFNQWYLASGHPSLNFSQYNDTISKVLSISVEQNHDITKYPIFKLPIQIAIFDSEGKHINKVVIDELTETFDLKYNGELKGVLYDNQNMLLADIKKEKSVDQYIYQYYQGAHYNARKESILKGTRKKTLQGQQLIIDALEDSFWKIRALAIEKFSKLEGEKRGEGLRKIKEMALNDVNSSVRAAAVGVIFKHLEGSEITNLYDNIINDSSYLVVSTALRNIAKLDPLLAMESAKFLEKEKSSKMILGIAQIYSTYAISDKLDFFLEALNGNTLQGFDKLGVLNSMTMYLSRQDFEALDKAYSFYSNLTKKATGYTKMFLPQNVKYLVRSLDSLIKEKFGDTNIDNSDEEFNKYNDLKRRYLALTSS